MNENIGLIITAWCLDIFLADPEWLPHPVIGIGWLAAKAETVLRASIKGKKFAGIIFWMVLCISVFLLIRLLLTMLSLLAPVLEQVCSVLILYTCFSTRSLAREAKAVADKLEKGKTIEARSSVSRIVGRDTECMGQSEIIRATIESVSENTVDGVIAPLFYAFLGGAPLAMAYKAINTLDSMVGYKNKRYREFGWFSAKMDDLANLIPSRLCLWIIPIASIFLYPQRVIKIIKIILRDGSKSPSPNAGYPEAGFAAALGLRLGGDCTYNGIAIHKPFIGEMEKQHNVSDIYAAVRLMWCCSVITLLSFVCMWSLLYTQ